MGQDAGGSGLYAGDGCQHGRHLVDLDLLSVEEKIPGVLTNLFPQCGRYTAHEVGLGNDEVEGERLRLLEPEAAICVGRAPNALDQHFDRSNDIRIVESEENVVADLDLVVVIEPFADPGRDDVSGCARLRLSQGFAQHDFRMLFDAGQKSQPGRLVLAQVFGQLFVGGGQKLEDTRRAIAGHAGERQARKLRCALTHKVIGAPVLFERSRAQKGHAMNEE